MPPIFILSMLRLGAGLAVAAMAGIAYGSDACGAWRMTDVDPSGGKYMMVVQLRACDLTGGVSAFVQFQNSGPERLKFRYRIYADEKIAKEGDLLLEPGQIQRGPTCQQCSSRKGGIQRWEIVSIDVLPAVEPSVLEASKIEVTPAATASPLPPEQPKPVMTSAPNAPPSTAVTPQRSTPLAAQTTTEPEGLVTEDGTVIPWDKLPPEFRPKK